MHPQNALFSIKDFALYAAKNGIGRYWALSNKAILRKTYAKSLQNLDLNQRILVSEDVLNFANLLFHAKNYACINDKLYFYRQNQNSIMQRTDAKKLHLTAQNHNLVIKTLLHLSANLSPLSQNLARIICIELEISNINFAKRALNKSTLNYLKTSFYKKFLRLKQRHFVAKIRRI
ncbi:hypothetical protein [Helicobacter sp. 23-1045]